MIPPKDLFAERPVRKRGVTRNDAMSYRSILVHAEVDPAAEPRLRLAADLANRFEAALIGVASEMFQPSTLASGAGYLDGETLVAEAKVVETDLRLAETKFRVAAKEVHGGAEWRSGVAMPLDMITHQARAADLIVAGPSRPEAYGFQTRANPGDLVMQAGRPVLVVPLDLEVLDASSVVICWKDTRESRRAMSDALPFLRRAREVLLAEVSEGRSETDARSQLADVAEHLLRHGVKASTTVLAPGKATVAATLLEIADMQDAGLIVAGGYGHARLQEWIFGGVTLELLSGARRAVMFSH